MQIQYAYLIHRTDDGTDHDRRTMSRGTRTTELTPAELAAELLADSRIGHDYYTGPRRCWVWELADEEVLPRIAPTGAASYGG